jgi:alpha-L-fucosidase
VHELVDVVSKNGNLLLNIGPRADGTIPVEIQQVLLAVGDWLHINGEAIYGTRPWTIYGEGPTNVVAGTFHEGDTKPYTTEDFRFTAKGNVIYAIQMAPPTNRKALIHSMGTSSMSKKVKSVNILGSGESVSFSQTAQGLSVDLPPISPRAFAICLRITIE